MPNREVPADSEPGRRPALARLESLEPAPERGHEARRARGPSHAEGDVSPFAPLLRAAEILHAGKGAVFGLGKVEVVAP